MFTRREMEVAPDHLPAKGHAVVHVGRHEQHVGVAGRDALHQPPGVQAERIVREGPGEGQVERTDRPDGSPSHRAAVGVVDACHGEAQRGGRTSEPRRELAGHEGDGRGAQDHPAGGHPEEGPAGCG